MDSTAVVLFGLAATSLLLCIALAVAWRRFGREAHAALWAFAYGLSAANWTANLLKVWLLSADSGLTLLSVVCSIGSFALIAIGFRRRAGLRLRLDAILVAAVVTVGFSSWAILRSHEYGVSRGLMILFCSVMLVVSARSLRAAQRNGRRATGGAAFWMLASFAAYTLGLGVLALFSPSGKSGPLFELYHLMMLMGVPTGLFGVGLFAMFLLAADLAEAMRQLAASDPLTGILNRRGFEQAATPLIAQSKRRSRPLALVIADIDRFKGINDRFGHNLGDIVLQRFTAHISDTVRQEDLFGRLGGEEFVILLPETSATAAVEAMERVREGLSAAVPELAAAGPLTASFGIAMLDGHRDTLSEILQRADEALYRSKLDGRDRITLAAASPASRDPLPDAWLPPLRRQAAG